MRCADRLMGLWLGLAVLLQASLLLGDAPLSYSQRLQVFIGAICLSLLVTYCWRSRRYLNSHADMLIIMWASGGLGMLFEMPVSSHAAPLIHIAVWWRMCAGMLALGILPAVAFSRCLRTARHHGYLFSALLIDSSSMLGGMSIAGCIPAAHGPWMMTSQHFSMLGGMTIGMIAGMTIRSAVFERRPLEAQARKEAVHDSVETRV